MKAARPGVSGAQYPTVNGQPVAPTGLPLVRQFVRGHEVQSPGADVALAAGATFADAIQGAAGVLVAARRERDDLALAACMDLDCADPDIAVAVAAGTAPGEENEVAALYRRLREQMTDRREQEARELAPTGT